MIIQNVVHNTNLKNLILMRKPTKYDGDKFQIVLLALPFGDVAVNFSTHLYSKERDDINQGHYYEDLRDAIKDYDRRN